MIRYRDENDNRIKRLIVPEERILNCFVLNAKLPGECQMKLSIRGIPPETFILSSYYDPMWASHTLILYNSQWPIVKRGEECPVLQLETEFVQVTPPAYSDVSYGKSDHQKAVEAQIAKEAHKDWSENESWLKRPSQL